ncbi:LexA family transcriptional regulator [Sphingomonas sp.]|uniref:LexA family transcriptional regulator n=1 Tax=Sphingomonas sp. TaxID=28214 RepID=UPI00307EE970
MYFAQVSRKYAPNNVRAIRQSRKMTLEALAHAISPDVALTTIAKIEKGTMSLTLDWMIDIARVLGVTVHDLIAEEGASFRMLPKVGRVAAGNWAEAIENPEGFVTVPAEGLTGDEFVLQVRGDSMDRVAPDGSWVVVDPSQCELVPGKYYVVRNGEGEATFKRFASDPLRLEPCSTNPEHRAIMIGAEPFTVIGRINRVWAEL